MSPRPHPLRSSAWRSWSSLRRAPVRARGANWDEIDLEGATWTIPGSRMKAGEEHRVPLSNQAVGVLTLARELQGGSGLCFPSPLLRGRMLSDMTLTKILRSTEPRGTGDGARLQDVLQDVGNGADGRALGCRRGGPGAPARGQCRAGLRQVRSLRTAAGADAAVVRLPHKLALSHQSGGFHGSAAEPRSLVDNGLDRIQAAISLDLHRTPEALTLTPRGNSPSKISL